MPKGFSQEPKIIQDNNLLHCSAATSIQLYRRKKPSLNKLTYMKIDYSNNERYDTSFSRKIRPNSYIKNDFQEKKLMVHRLYINSPLIDIKKHFKKQNLSASFAPRRFLVKGITMNMTPLLRRSWFPNIRRKHRSEISNYVASLREKFQVITSTPLKPRR